MRQYFRAPLADPLLAPISAVSPGTTPTFLLSQTQANKFLPLPNGQNAPSPGSLFKVTLGGLVTSVAGTFIVTPFHGAGTSATAGGTSLGASETITGIAFTSGFFLIEGHLVYRSISEVATASTAWFMGRMHLGGPAANTNAPLTFMMGSTAAVSVDTTGTGSVGTFGALNFMISPGTTGSSWTTEFAYIEQLN